MHLSVARQSKRSAGGSLRVDEQDLKLGKYRARVEATLGIWDEIDFGTRLWQKDRALWSAEPVPELEDRLDWIDLPETMVERVPALMALAEEVRREGFHYVVLLGMGGSSLTAEVFAETFGRAPGYPALVILDSTHPGTIGDVMRRIDAPQTLFIVASKSGTTLEPISLFRFFWDWMAHAVAHPGRHFVAVTDPRTSLESLARERQFRNVFLASPNLGGRYSALSEFGLLPAALIGVDVHDLLRRSAIMASACGQSVAVAANPGLILGAALGELALAGRDKVTFFASSKLAALPGWLEQLIAESTGKSGLGILPVVNEMPGPPEVYGPDRCFVVLTVKGDDIRGVDSALSRLGAAGHPIIRVRLPEPADIVQEMFRWEIAVAAAGALLGIHPFNQPDVELAKDLARAVMKSEKAEKGGRALLSTDIVSSDDHGALGAKLKMWLAAARPGHYVALQVFLAARDETTIALECLRHELRDRLKLATTLDYGPRFLHSTGQLHKGGPNNGLFLQLIDDSESDLPVPETDYSFGTVLLAQALGDYRALEQRGRTVLRVRLTGQIDDALGRVMAVLREAFED